MTAILDDPIEADNQMVNSTAVSDVVRAIRNAVAPRAWSAQAESMYTLIIGAGFSHPSVPLTRKIVREEIGEFFYLQDMELPGARTRSQKERNSIRFWREFNAALPESVHVTLNAVGLPADPSAAYRSLFAMRATSAEFYAGFENGADFLKRFLRHLVNPGWAHLNDAHFLLGCLLELQQWGSLRVRQPFARRIFTTNFDTLLQQTLQDVGVLYTISDRPATGFTADEFAVEDEEAIHLVYTHGSILRHNPANTDEEIRRLRALNATMITPWLEQHGVIVVGYGGWDDGIMAALSACRRFKRGLYWCDVHAVEAAASKLPTNVISLLAKEPTERFYVPMGDGGADHFMASLYEALALDSQGERAVQDTGSVNSIKQLGLERRGPTASERHKRALEICARYRSA
jgi:hypothetical protein